MARAKYDLERFCKDVETVLKAKLNDKITEINAEKNDGLELLTIDAKAYVFQNLNDKVNNFKVCLFYYIDDLGALAIDSATAEDISLDVVIIIPNSQETNGTQTYRLLRYLRCLKELFNDHFNGVKSNLKVKVESLVPIQFALQNSSHYADAIGIKLTTSIV